MAVYQIRSIIIMFSLILVATAECLLMFFNDDEEGRRVKSFVPYHSYFKTLFNSTSYSPVVTGG